LFWLAEGNMGSLCAKLREDCGNLRDAGWDSTAKLMEIAADELERLNRRVMDLEGRLKAPSPPSARSLFVAKPISSHPYLVSY
jgi:hypothetical protein